MPTVVTAGLIGGDTAISPLPFLVQIVTEVGHGLFARLILRSDIVAIDCQVAVPIQRDEYASATNLCRIKDRRAPLKGFHRRFHLAKPGVDLLGVFVLTRVFLFKCAILHKQLGMLCSFIRAERRWIGVYDEGHELFQRHDILGIDIQKGTATDASFNRCFTICGVTKKAAAMASSP